MVTTATDDERFQALLACAKLVANGGPLLTLALELYGPEHEPVVRALMRVYEVRGAFEPGYFEPHVQYVLAGVHHYSLTQLAADAAYQTHSEPVPR